MRDRNRNDDDDARDHKWGTPPKPEHIAVFEEWLAGRDEIEQTARAHPPWHCYRLPTQPHGHYTIYSYNEAKPNAYGVTITLTHGADSFLPGVRVFGVDPDDLVICDCGDYSAPTREQLEHMNEHFAALERARACAPKPKGKLRVREIGRPGRDGCVIMELVPPSKGGGGGDMEPDA